MTVKKRKKIYRKMIQEQNVKFVKENSQRIEYQNIKKYAKNKKIIQKKELFLILPKKELY